MQKNFLNPITRVLATPCDKKPYPVVVEFIILDFIVFLKIHSVSVEKKKKSFNKIIFARMVILNLLKKVGAKDVHSAGIWAHTENENSIDQFSTFSEL